MDDISNLIREAKPLYFARKRRNNRIKAGLATLVFIFMLGNFIPLKYNSYTYGLDTEMEQAIAQIEDGSVIEEMGLPTDEYGLLMVG